MDFMSYPDDLVVKTPGQRANHGNRLKVCIIIR